MEFDIISRHRLTVVQCGEESVGVATETNRVKVVNIDGNSRNDGDIVRVVDVVEQDVGIIGRVDDVLQEVDAINLRYRVQEPSEKRTRDGCQVSAGTSDLAVDVGHVEQKCQIVIDVAAQIVTLRVAFTNLHELDAHRLTWLSLVHDRVENDLIGQLTKLQSIDARDEIQGFDTPSLKRGWDLRLNLTRREGGEVLTSAWLDHFRDGAVDVANDDTSQLTVDFTISGVVLP